jgi:hypothetical protein
LGPCEHNFKTALEPFRLNLNPSNNGGHGWPMSLKLLKQGKLLLSAAQVVAVVRHRKVPIPV